MQVGVEILLYLFQRLVPGLSPLDAEVLVQQGPVQSFDEAIALRTAHFGGAMLDPFELQDSS